LKYYIYILPGTLVRQYDTDVQIKMSHILIPIVAPALMI
jgi:hypothetical protein